MPYLYSPPDVTQPDAHTILINTPSAGTSIRVAVSPNVITPSKILISVFEGEVQFSLALPFGTFPSLGLTGVGANALATGQNSNYGLSFAPTAPKDEFNDLGGLDFSFKLLTKPAIPPSSFNFTLGDNIGIVGYVQPSLTKEFKVGQVHRPSGRVIASVTDTDVTGSDGLVVVHRPIHVVNAIAFKADGKSGDYTALGGKNYKSGLVGHLYSGKWVDNNGNSAPAGWSLPTPTTPTLNDPTGFLAAPTTVYPVTFQPLGDIFGFKTHSATTDYLVADYEVWWSGTYTPGSAGTGVSMTWYGSGNSNGTFYMAVYNSSGRGLVTNATCSAAITTTLGEFTGNFGVAPSITATAKLLVANSSVDWNRYYTSTAPDSYDAAKAHGVWDNPLPAGSDESVAAKFDIWCTYTPSGGTTAYKDITTRFNLIAQNFKNVATRFKLTARNYKDIATRFQLTARGYKDVATRFRLWATSYKDISTRYKLTVRNYNDISTRFWLWATSYKDALTRFRLTIQGYKDISTRLLLIIQAYKDISTKFILRGQAYRDTATRFFIQVGTLAYSNIATRFKLNVQSYKDISTRFYLWGQGYKDISTRFLLRVQSYKDISTRFLLNGRGYKDISTRFLLQVAGGGAAYPIIGGSHIIQ